MKNIECRIMEMANQEMKNIIIHGTAYGESRKQISPHYENSECCECNGKLYGKRSFAVPVGNPKLPHFKIVCEDCAERLAP